MGKTVPSYRMALEDEILGWRKFAEAQDTQDQDAFNVLMDASRNYCMAAGNATRPVVFEAMAMSIMLYQQKKLDKLEKELGSLKIEETHPNTQTC